MAAKTPIKFDNAGTHDGVTVWYINDADGNAIGTLERERPVRWHKNGVSGLVRDNEKPWQWFAEIDGKSIRIPDGATLAQVKEILISVHAGPEILKAIRSLIVAKSVS